MGLRDQSIVGCFPELCFSVFRGACACVVVKTIYKQFFPTRACVGLIIMIMMLGIMQEVMEPV